MCTPTAQASHSSTVAAHLSNPDCPVWCVHRSTPDHGHDPACWGVDESVNLGLEQGDDTDPPRVAAVAYRREPGRRPLAKLHLYRPSDNTHRHIDDEVELTAVEARQLAAALLRVADTIEGSRA